MTPASVGFHCPECVAGGRAATRAPRGGGLQSAGRRWGPVTLTLIGLNVAVFVATAVSAALVHLNPLVDNSSSPLGSALVQVPDLVRAGEWWRPFTAAFEHIGVIHLAVNMLSLLVIGSPLEFALGRWRYAAVYAISLLGGAAALQLLGLPDAGAAGASTAIFGLFGAFGVLLFVQKQPLQGFVSLLIVNALLKVVFPSISLTGHLGGLVAGAAATALLLGTRRIRGGQAAALGGLAAGLLVVTLVAPTVAPLGL